MKFLVIISACIAVSSASHPGAIAVAPVAAAAPIAYGYTGPLADSVPASLAGFQNLPDGAIVPKDTPSVLAARADHFAARGAAYAAAGPIVAAAPVIAAPAIAAPAIAAPVIAAPAPVIAAAPAVAYGYTGPFADDLPASAAGLQTLPNGAVVPKDTPSVLAARADHFAARGAAYAAAGPIVAAAPAIAAPVIAAPAIAAPAIAAPAIAAPAPVIAAAPAVAYGYTGPYADELPASAAGLQTLPNGAVVPKDTPSVLAARADHFAARGDFFPFAGPTGRLVPFPNGALVPADEPAVVAARADHLAAKGGLGW